MIMPEAAENNANRKKKTVFVFSGGSGLGSVQVGMVKALFRKRGSFGIS